jgi:hypothetical protein
MAGGNRTSIRNPRQRFLTGTSVEPSGRPRSQPTASPSGRSSPIVSSMPSPSRFSVQSSARSPCPSEAPQDPNDDDDDVQDVPDIRFRKQKRITQQDILRLPTSAEQIDLTRQATIRITTNKQYLNRIETFKSWCTQTYNPDNNESGPGHPIDPAQLSSDLPQVITSYLAGAVFRNCKSQTTFDGHYSALVW